MVMVSAALSIIGVSRQPGICGAKRQSRQCIPSRRCFFPSRHAAFTEYADTVRNIASDVLV